VPRRAGFYYPGGECVPVWSIRARESIIALARPSDAADAGLCPSKVLDYREGQSLQRMSGKPSNAAYFDILATGFQDRHPGVQQLLELF
jgi:hypothetical protein